VLISSDLYKSTDQIQRPGCYNTPYTIHHTRPCQSDKGSHSEQPGDHRDVPFDASEFVDACYMVVDGPFVNENENWLRVVRMLTRILTLRIPLSPFCDKHEHRMMALQGTGIIREFFPFLWPPIETHPFDLPFSVHEFLTICDEFEKYEAGDKLLPVSNYAGSRRLFLRMVKDLSIRCMSLGDFLADHIPASMEENAILIRLLRSVQDQYGRLGKISFRGFLKLIYTLHGFESRGNIVGPMSHSQAAVFAQQLDTVMPDPEVVELTSMIISHLPANAEVEVEEFVRTPCCNTNVARSILIEMLMEDGFTCFCCCEDMR
jgi:hypothetical protein